VIRPNNVDELVEAFGGDLEVAAICGRRSRGTILEWRRLGYIPWPHYPKLRDAGRSHRDPATGELLIIAVPEDLFRQVSRSERSEAA
jgi:hypothetical protein